MTDKPINLITLTGITPLIIRVHEEDGEASVYFAPVSNQTLDIRAGDLVLIRARIYETRVKGGYETSNKEHIKGQLRFSLDIGDIRLIELQPVPKERKGS